MKLSPSFWKFCLVLLAIVWLLAELSVSLFGDHKITEGMKLWSKKPPTFSLHFNSTQHIIYLSGTLDIGIVPEFENLLNKNPTSTGVVLESKGGNIYQARGLANIIIQHELDTYSFSYCHSACTIAFVAGKNRYLKKQAELGFHCYSLESCVTQPFISIAEEQTKDLHFFKKQILDENFVDKIFQRKSNELWIPKVTELLKAGVIHEIISD